MHTGSNSNNMEDYQEKSQQSSQQSSTMGNENYKSQEMNREHSDNVRAGEHNYQQDETQYGKIRQSESGPGRTEQRADHLRDQVNEGMHHAGSKVNEWTDKAENKMDQMKDRVDDKMNEWTGNSNRAEDKYDSADRKMDKADKKMDKAQEKFAEGNPHDGMRKMEKAEKKMDKADEKIRDAHEEIGHQNNPYQPGRNTGNDNAEDYNKRAETGNTNFRS